jgi:hypothetical protein
MDRSGDRRRVKLLCGTQRHTKESARSRRILTPSTQSISRPTRLDSWLGRTITPSFGISLLANKYKHSHTMVRWKQRNTRPTVIESQQSEFAIIRASLRQQRRPLARGHQRESSPLLQHRSPLVQQPPVGRIRRCNQGIRRVHRVRSLGMVNPQERQGTRASSSRRKGNSSHTLQLVPSRFGTRPHTPSSVSSITLRTYVQSHSLQTTGFSQSARRKKLPSKAYPGSLSVSRSAAF